MPGAVGVFQTNLNAIGEFLDLYSQDSLTATASGTQANSIQITRQVTRFSTVASAGDAAVLPAWAQGRAPTVINSGVNSMNVFPPVGGQINGQAVNIALALPAGSVVDFFTSSAPGTVGQWFANVTNPSSTLPFSQVVSISSGNATLTGAQMAGAANSELTTSGATALTTATAAQMLAAMPGAPIGVQWIWRVINTNGGTMTLTADASVTQTIGAMTVATNTWREFEMTITAATTATMKGRGTGTFS